MKVGIIGGSGLDDPKLVENYKEVTVETPYGEPSSKIISGKISGIEVFILARHNKNHEIPPSQVNSRANIYALKKLGCNYILSTTAVGSLREEIDRGDFVILDQFIDFTRHRKISFYDSFQKGDAKHTPMADPFSDFLRKKIISVCRSEGIKYHPTGTVVTIEGPRFSTRAESEMFRIWGADVINMSIAPEAALAKEAGIEYASIAMSTDYDCWKTDEEPVTWDIILETFNKNAEKMKKILLKVIKILPEAEEEVVMKTNTVSYNGKYEDFIKEKIRTVPDWPKKGVMFRDITTLLQDAGGFEKTIEVLADRYKDANIDLIAGIESRGFVIASALASKIRKGIVLIRKKGKLPFETVSESYQLEYGSDSVEIHKDAIKPGDRILLVDDLIATGGTCAASGRLIERLGGEVIECAFVIDLPELKGTEKLKWPVFKVVDFEGK